VRRAYFHARARRLVYVKLPEEDYEEGKRGKLIKAMYGAREAAQNLECESVEFMEGIGFRRGNPAPRTFWHEGRGLRAVIHGDDFTLLVNELVLDWFREKIRERFEVKVRGRLGPGNQDDKSMRILSRILSWDQDGIKYEADQRHTEIIIRQLRLEGMSSGVSTPGNRAEEEGGERKLGKKEATQYRRLVARCKYL